MAIIRGRIATLRHHVIDQSKHEIACHVQRMKKLKNKNEKLLITQNLTNKTVFEVLGKNILCQVLL